jgi:hypothetical protein
VQISQASLATAVRCVQVQTGKRMIADDASSSPASARIETFSYTEAFGPGAPKSPAFNPDCIRQHLLACSRFEAGAASAVSAAAEACPDKKRLLVSLMASVSAALESMNVVLEMCEGSMAPRLQVCFGHPSGMPPAATGWHLPRLLTSH